MVTQVLARKWRPQNFSELIGQPFVADALAHALKTKRLHHAYLFSGTRGVGKTTIARILAKALNCETGVTPTPCGTCAVCQSIETGHFPDLIEVDAASNTKVEDTRTLLDNVPYAPTAGRYKVYLIDEVHMLSQHSFNALLKTLEEPPSHVVFILATTDPDKLPVTVLSRCLQFQLRHITPADIQKHLSSVLEAEKIPVEQAALAPIAQAADGSMRDALSLLERAIALGAGQVKADVVHQWLGAASHAQALCVLEAVVENQPATALGAATEALSSGTTGQALLERLLSLCHQMSMLQLLSGYPIDEGREALDALASRCEPEKTQLFYEILMHGLKDLPYAPTPEMGVEMTVCRLLAFTPDTGGQVRQVKKQKAPVKKTPAPMKTTATSQSAKVLAPQVTPPESTKSEDWGGLVAQLPLKGFVKMLAENCICREITDNVVTLVLDEDQKPLHNDARQKTLAEALQAHLGRPVRVEMQVGDVKAASPQQKAVKAAATKQADAEASVSTDATVQAFVNDMDATIERVTTID